MLVVQGGAGWVVHWRLVKLIKSEASQKQNNETRPGSGISPSQ